MDTLYYSHPPAHLNADGKCHGAFLDAFQFNRQLIVSINPSTLSGITVTNTHPTAHSDDCSAKPDPFHATDHVSADN